MEYKFINPEYLNSVSAGDDSVTFEIIALFKVQVVEIYDQMKSFLTLKDYTSLGLLAHKAKSSVAIMGMSDLASMLKTFELQAKEGNGIDKYESYVNRFRDETAEAVKELDDLVAGKITGSDDKR